MPSKIIPINKGNYSMDTPEREKRFDEYKGEDWPEGYQSYRKKWTDYATNQYVSEYPLLVDLELASVCNLKCPMCYTITPEFKEKVNATLMDYNLYKKIIDEIGGKVPAIRLSLRGEATLHPKFIECIRYAKEKGIKEVSTLTHGGKLTEDYFLKMVDAGIDWITISIDGLGETYEKIRKPIKFSNILEIVKNIKRIKQKKRIHKPVIKVQSIWPAIKDNPEAFYNTFEPYVDLVAFNPLIDYLGCDTEIKYMDNFSCPQQYQRLVIGADGKVMKCSNDEHEEEIVDDANLKTIYNIWHGNNLGRVRELHQQTNGFLQSPVCRKCYLPRLTVDNETARVNGRKIIIKNYIFRSQTIGK